MRLYYRLKYSSASWIIDPSKRAADIGNLETTFVGLTKELFRNCDVFSQLWNEVLKWVDVHPQSFISAFDRLYWRLQRENVNCDRWSSTLSIICRKRYEIKFCERTTLFLFIYKLSWHSVAIPIINARTLKWAYHL